MVWQGSIKFINSFNSPRRGGLFELVSVLSVEGDGLIAFKVSLGYAVAAVPGSSRALCTLQNGCIPPRCLGKVQCKYVHFGCAAV
jgi:hypothetical protein